MSEMSNELDMIVAECLERVQRGQWTVADCVERYPGYADDLRLALGMARLTSRLKKPVMDAGAVDVLEARLREEMVVQRHVMRRQLRLTPAISRLAAAIIIAFMLAFGTGAGLVAASADDLPGDTLYGIKRLWEAIVLALAPLTGQLDDLWLRLAQTRLDEVKALEADGRLTPEALNDLYWATAQAVAFADADSQVEISTFLDTVYNQLPEMPPSQAAPVYQELERLTNPGARDTIFQQSSSPEPLSLPGSSPTPTASATMTATPTLPPTLTATLTPTDTPTGTPAATATDTRTPTPSRTPTLTPTGTATATPTPTSTATWTPLPLPVRPTYERVDPTATSASSSAPPISVTLPPLELTVRLRETELSVYLTQTAWPLQQLTPTESP